MRQPAIRGGCGLGIGKHAKTPLAGSDIRLGGESVILREPGMMREVAEEAVIILRRGCQRVRQPSVSHAAAGLRKGLIDRLPNEIVGEIVFTVGQAAQKTSTLKLFHVPVQRNLGTLQRSADQFGAKGVTNLPRRIG